MAALKEEMKEFSGKWNDPAYEDVNSDDERYKRDKRI